MDLKVYSTKLRPGTKKRLKALAEANCCSGQRELLEAMITAYENKHPLGAIKADKYQELMDK